MDEGSLCSVKQLSITIGVTTYNRLEYLLAMQRSLCACAYLEKCNLRIYDDASEEYGLEELWRLFPWAREIVRRPVNLGAEANLRQMCEDFLSTGDELLVVADADLIFHAEWVPAVWQRIALTDGIFSLFNSAVHHPGIRDWDLDGYLFEEKSHLGAAGLVMHKDVVSQIIQQIKITARFDWALSAFLAERRVRLLACKDSFVQHIGLTGVNCDGLLTVEISEYFSPGSDVNREILCNFYPRMIVELHKRARRQERKVRLLQETTLGRLLLLLTTAKKGGHKLLRKTRKKIKHTVKRVRKDVAWLIHW